MKWICHNCRKLMNEKEVIVAYGNMQNCYYHLKCLNIESRYQAKLEKEVKK